MSMFPPAPPAFRQPLAYGRAQAASGFDFGRRIAQSGCRQAAVPRAPACRPDCYPSPFLRSGSAFAGPGLLLRQSAADGQGRAFFPFSGEDVAICCQAIKNPTRGSRSCSRRNSSLRLFWQPALPVAWQPRRNAALPAPLSAQPSPMQPTRTSWPVRPLAGLPVRQAVACPACRPAPRATDDLTAAPARGFPSDKGPSGAAPRMAFSFPRRDAAALCPHLPRQGQHHMDSHARAATALAHARDPRRHPVPDPSRRLDRFARSGPHPLPADAQQK